LRQPSGRTPACSLAGRAGVLVLAVAPFFACTEAPAPPVVLVLGSDSFPLARGARIHDVALRGSIDGPRIAPATVEAGVGDVIRFTAADRAGHAIVFEGEALDSAGIRFLEATGQRRSPPLLDEGAAWIVSTDGAPAGSWPFLCLMHGARGRIELASR
jgi:plastocyanin